ncbi:MAG: ABC transporter permease [Streptosporangiaceae bacterium]
MSATRVDHHRRSVSALRWGPLLQIVSLVIGAALWELLGGMKVSILFPPFSKVVSALWNLLDSGQLTAPLEDSFKTFGIGLGISLGAGLIVGLAMGVNKNVRAVLGTYINLVMAIPPVAFIPLLLIWIGPGDEVQIFVILTFTLPGLVVNTERAIATVDENHVAMARSFGVRGVRLLCSVMIPDGLSLILAGIRISISRAVKGMIIAEVLIAATGLGGLLQNYGAGLEAANVFAIILTIVVIAIVLSELIRLVERSLLRWQADQV